MSDRSSKPDLPLIAELRESAKLDDLNRDRQEAIALAVFDRVAGRIRRDRAMGSWLRRAAQFVGALGTMKVAVALALSGGIVTAAARQWVHRPEAPAIAADRDATSRKASAPNAGVPQRGATDPTAGEPSTAAPDRLPEAAPQTPTTFGATGRSPEHDGLKRETELVDAARSALARNQPATAIALLDRYRAEFPKGRLVAAAGLVQAESLFASGRAAEAVRVARAHLQINPHGQFADKLAAVIARAEGQSKESPKATSP